MQKKPRGFIKMRRFLFRKSTIKKQKKTYAKIFIYSSCHSMKSMCTCFFLFRVNSLAEQTRAFAGFFFLFFHALHLTSRVKNRPQFPVCHLCVSVSCICKSCVELTLPLLAFTEGIIMESCCFIFQWNRLLQQKKCKKKE